MRALILLITMFWCSYTALASDSRIKVVVIDTGISDEWRSKANLCPEEHKDFTGTGLNDTHGHGTNVVGLIVENAPVRNYCIVVVKAYDRDKQYVTAALFYALTIKADVINLSGGGIGPQFAEQWIVSKLLERKVLMIVAAGNNGTDLDKDCNFYPACYDKRITVVGAEAKYSNHGKVVDVVLSGKDQTAFGKTFHGTSQATAIFTGRFLKGVAQKQQRR